PVASTSEMPVSFSRLDNAIGLSQHTTARYRKYRNGIHSDERTFERYLNCHDRRGRPLRRITRRWTLRRRGAWRQHCSCTDATNDNAGCKLNPSHSNSMFARTARLAAQILLLLLGPALVCAQPARGVVVDQTNLPLPGVR